MMRRWRCRWPRPRRSVSIPSRPGRARADLTSARPRASMDRMPTDVPPLPALIALYLANCRVEGKSPRTLQAYRWTLERFQRALREDGAPQDVGALGPAHVIAYLERSAHLARETRHRYFREVRCFFAWGQRTGFLQDTPFRGLRNVQVPLRVVQPFRREEVAQLLDACDPVSPMGLRDRALLLTLLDSGIRCSETVGLDLFDCDFTTRRLHVRHGKGHKERVVPFAARCAEALSAYTAAPRRRAGGPLRQRPLRAPRSEHPAPAQRPQATAPPPRARDRHPQGARPPLPPHLRHLGDLPRGARDRYQTFARACGARDAPPLHRDLPCRASRPAPCALFARRPDAQQPGRVVGRRRASLSIAPPQIAPLLPQFRPTSAA